MADAPALFASHFSFNREPAASACTDKTLVSFCTRARRWLAVKRFGNENDIPMSLAPRPHSLTPHHKQTLTGVADACDNLTELAAFSRRSENTDC